MWGRLVAFHFKTVVSLVGKICWRISNKCRTITQKVLDKNENCMLTAPESLTTLTFCGTCWPSKFLARCITVLLVPGLGPWVWVWVWFWFWGWGWGWAWLGPTEGVTGMFFWGTWLDWIWAPGLFTFCTALFLRCCCSCCWFCWGCFHCWSGPGPGVCCCWVLPFTICRRALTLGRGVGVWVLPLGGMGVLWLGFFNDWFNDCGVLWGNCLCCCGCSCCCCCFCSCCCCGGGGGGCCCTGCGIWFCCEDWTCEGAGPWLGVFVWELSLSSSSFFLTPACICRRISFLFRISSLRRFCSSIFRRYCRVSSSSSGSCGTKYKLTIWLPVSTYWKGSHEPPCPIWTILLGLTLM